jgi:hypothetical protein
MTNQYPITPPPELLTQWENDWFNEREHADVLLVNAYAAGAQAGADHEIEACVKWLEWNHSDLLGRDLRAARRPKPPSLKQEALEALSRRSTFTLDRDRDTIRRALEQIND